MRDELDKQLCEKYPKIFKDRNADMRTTAMCWGFECDDGWYNIIDQLCGNIQSHIDWNNEQRQWAISYNEMAQAGKDGNTELFESLVAKEYDDKAYDSDYIKKRCEAMIEQPLRKVPDQIPQVVATQVKEKYGTLRFYYSGGDDVIDGMVRMAESISGVTCEECGKPGTQNSGGWIRTLCEEHTK